VLAALSWNSRGGILDAPEPGDVMAGPPE